VQVGDSATGQGCANRVLQRRVSEDRGKGGGGERERHPILPVSPNKTKLSQTNKSTAGSKSALKCAMMGGPKSILHTLSNRSMWRCKPHKKTGSFKVK